MPLPIISGVVRAAVSGLLESGQVWTNVWHFHTSATWDGTHINTLDADLFKFYAGPAYATSPGNFLLQKCAAGVTLTKITYTPLDGSSASVVKGHAGVGSQGAGGSLPSECAEVMTLYSGFRGRSKRGRIYFPVWHTGSRSTNGTIDSGSITDILTNYTGFVAQLGTDSISHVIASYKLSSSVSVASVTMDNKFDVQRRRK